MITNYDPNQTDIESTYIKILIFLLAFAVVVATPFVAYYCDPSQGEEITASTSTEQSDSEETKPDVIVQQEK